MGKMTNPSISRHGALPPSHPSPARTQNSSFTDLWRLWAYPTCACVASLFMFVMAFTPAPAQRSLRVVTGPLEDVSYRKSRATTHWIAVQVGDSRETFVYHEDDPMYDEVQMAFWPDFSQGRRIPVNVELLVDSSRFGDADIWQVKRDDQMVVSYQDVYNYREGLRKHRVAARLLFASAMLLWGGYGMRKALQAYPARPAA